MRSAADCQAIIHAWHGYSYDSSRVGEKCIVDEARNRISIKSQNYVGADLNPGFSCLVHDVDESIWRGDMPGLEANQISETFAMLMGL